MALSPIHITSINRNSNDAKELFHAGLSFDMSEHLSKVHFAHACGRGWRPGRPRRSAEQRETVARSLPLLTAALSSPAPRSTHATRAPRRGRHSH